jgi:hypothetical protein
MYLLTLSNTVTKSTADSTSGNQPSQSPSTMTQAYGGALAEDPIQAIRGSLTLNSVVWRPVHCGDIVVYVRRALGC